MTFDEAWGLTEKRSMLYPEDIVLLSETLSQAPAEGVAIECGSYCGGTVACLALLYPARHFYAYDSREGGLTGTQEVDRPFLRDGMLAWPMAEVREWTTSLGIKNVDHIRQDLSSETPAPHAPVAWVLLDVDLYAPTRKTLWALRPFLLPGAVVMVDDAAFPGVGQALQEWEMMGERFVKQGRFMRWENT